MPLRDATVYRDRIVAADRPAEPSEQGARWVVSLDEMVKRRSLPVQDDLPVSHTTPVHVWPEEMEDGQDTKVWEDRPLHAFVERGSWLVKCPCGSAALACRSDHRFYCVTCENVAVGGAWIEVLWPEDPEAIEGILMQRMYVVNRNWRYGETLETLQAENDANNQAAMR